MSERYSPERDLAGSSRRTRHSITVSFVLHVLLFLWLAVRPGGAQVEGLTEITWVENGRPDGVPDAAPPVAEKETKSAPIREVALTPSREVDAPEHFERALERGTVAPRPQSSRSVTDLMDERLASYESDARESTTRIAALVPPPRVGVPALAGVPGAPPGRNGGPSSLKRGGTPGGGGSAPIALRRITAPPVAPVMAATVAEPPVSAAPTVATTPGGRGARDLAGAQLIGPVADRAIVSYQVPDYPEWAKRDGIEGSVTLYFFVLPDGRVKENVLVERTSGFADFDKGAVDALLGWRFVALPGGPAANEQWGRITFHYRLSDAH